jgi:hypothetical protein
LEIPWFLFGFPGFLIEFRRSSRFWAKGTKSKKQKLFFVRCCFFSYFYLDFA